MSRAVEVGLDAIVQRIRNLTGELKALFSHVIKEAEDLEFDFLKGLAVTMVRDIKDWDQPTINTLLRQNKEMEAQWEEEGLNHKQKLERILEEVPEPRGRGIFPVEERWALEWEDIEEDTEAARRISEDPESWIPPSWDISCGVDTLATFRQRR